MKLAQRQQDGGVTSYGTQCRISAGVTVLGYGAALLSAILACTVPAMGASVAKPLSKLIETPFSPVAGSYQGLFLADNSVALENSGFVSVTVVRTGAFTAKLLNNGKSYGFSGQFAADGSASQGLTLAGGVGATVTLQLDFGGEDTLTGTVTTGAWTANLRAYRGSLYGKEHAGKLTLLMPGPENSSSQPAGDSFGTVSLSAAGSAKLGGALADGTALSASGSVSRQGQWPVYASLYKGKGALFGWVTITDQRDGDLSGNLYWIKTRQTAKLYAGGFTNVFSVLGSRIHLQKGMPIITPSNSSLWLANGNLPGAFTNEIALDARNKVSSPNKALKVSVKTASGLFSGSILNPYTTPSLKTLKFKGVILQKQNFASGFFLGADQSGRVAMGDYLAQQTPTLIVAGTDTVEANVTIGNSEQTVTVSSGPLSGVTITLPLGALPAGDQVTVARNDALMTSRTGTEPAACLDLKVDGGSASFAQPVAVTVPFTDPDTIPIPFYVAPSGVLKACQIVSVDSVAHTLTFETFHASLYTWLLTSVPRSLLEAAEANATSYRPWGDGFQVVNTGSEYNPGGECFGMTTWEQWYYREKADSFYPKYMQNLPLGANGRTIQGQAVIATRAFNSVARMWTWYMPRVTASYNLTPAQRYASIVRTLNATRVPTILYLTSSQAGSGAHSVLVYDYVGNANGGVLLINDPNYPGAVRSLEFDAAQPDSFSYGAYDSVTVSGDGSFQTENFDNIYADAEAGFDGNGAAQVNVYSHTDGQHVSGRTITLYGTIQSGQVLVSKLSLVLNGSATVETPVDSNGYFSVEMSLNANTNLLGFKTWGYNGADQLVEVLNTQRTPFRIVCDSSGAVILATLTWDTETDVDLYSIDPVGDYSCYYHEVTADGGELDYDNTYGYGPEHWTLNWDDTIRWGEPYTIRVHYYRGSPVTTWTVNILLYEGTSQMVSYNYSGVVSSADGSSNDGPNDAGASWSDVCTIVPVQSTAAVRQPLVRKSASGEWQITVPVPSLNERLRAKALDWAGVR